MATRVIAFVLLAAVIWTAERWYVEVVLPPQTRHASVATLNGSDEDQQNLQAIEFRKHLVTGGAGVLTLVAAAACFLRWSPVIVNVNIDKRTNMTGPPNAK